MFDGIVMNVIDMPLEIGVVADDVLPKAALPNSNLAFGDFAVRTRLRGREAA